MRKKHKLLAVVLPMLCLMSCGNTVEPTEKPEDAAAAVTTVTTELKTTSSETTTETTAESAVTTTTETTMEKENITINYSSSEKLPENAEKAVVRFLQSSDYDELFYSVFPASVHEELMKKSPAANYFFGGCPFTEHTDTEITECTRIPESQAEKLSSFLVLSCAAMGVDADFSADDGYDIVIKSICTLEEYKFLVQERYMVLHIADDEWILLNSSDENTNTLEMIQ